MRLGKGMSKLFFALIAVLLAVCPSLAQRARAETLYRCIGPNDSVSYQSTSCAAGTRLDRTLDYRPEPANQAPAESRLYRYRPGPYGAGGTSRGRRSSLRSAVAPSSSVRCQSAKEGRRSALDRLGLRRTYVQLSQLDAKVRAVCHGF